MTLQDIYKYYPNELSLLLRSYGIANIDYPNLAALVNQNDAFRNDLESIIGEDVSNWFGSKIVAQIKEKKAARQDAISNGEKPKTLVGGLIAKAIPRKANPALAKMNTAVTGGNYASLISANIDKAIQLNNQTPIQSGNLIDTKALEKKTSLGEVLSAVGKGVNVIGDVVTAIKGQDTTTSNEPAAGPTAEEIAAAKKLEQKEKLKQYLPYIIGGVVVIGLGLFFILRKKKS